MTNNFKNGFLDKLAELKDGQQVATGTQTSVSPVTYASTPAGKVSFPSMDAFKEHIGKWNDNVVVPKKRMYAGVPGVDYNDTYYQPGYWNNVNIHRFDGGGILGGYVSPDEPPNNIHVDYTKQDPVDYVKQLYPDIPTRLTEVRDLKQFEGQPWLLPLGITSKDFEYSGTSSKQINPASILANQPQYKNPAGIRISPSFTLHEGTHDQNMDARTGEERSSGRSAKENELLAEGYGFDPSDITMGEGEPLQEAATTNRQVQRWIGEQNGLQGDPGDFERLQEILGNMTPDDYRTWMEEHGKDVNGYLNHRLQFADPEYVRKYAENEIKLEDSERIKAERLKKVNELLAGYGDIGSMTPEEIVAQPWYGKYKEYLDKYDGGVRRNGLTPRDAARLIKQYEEHHLGPNAVPVEDWVEPADYQDRVQEMYNRLYRPIDWQKMKDAIYYVAGNQGPGYPQAEKTAAFNRGYMDKLAAIKSPEDLDALYAKLKYRILNQKTNHPYFNTNRETFDNWHLLSPEQIKKHKIGICWDTAAMTDKVLSDLGVEHANYFAHSKDLSKATHGFNVYKDKDGNWRWIEGAWEPYKGNDWKERRKKDLVKRIVRALEEAGGDKQIIHLVDKFPEPGVGDKEFYEEMLKKPVKKAAFEKKADPPNRGIHDTNPFIRYANRHYGFVPQAPDSFLRDANSEDDFNRVTAEAIYNIGKENPDIEHRYGYDRNNALDDYLYDYFTAAGSRHNTTANWPGGILFGSYPSERKTVALHELGHGHDPVLNKERENGDLFSERSTIDEENYAWDWAGIPEDNPIRQAAMATYYNNDPGLRDKLHDKFWEEASKDSESWRSVDPSVNTNGVPMYSRIMDARAAGNNQLFTPSDPDNYIKYYPGIKQHLGEITRANDDLPPNKTHIYYPKTEEHRQYNLSHIYPKAWMW